MRIKINNALFKFKRSSIIHLFLKIPLPLFFFKSLEKFSSIYQGKGWGTSSIKEEVNVCLSLLKEKPSLFIDIGANKGLYTQFILKNFPDIECHLFEPSNKNYKNLINLFNKNNKIKVNNLALGKKDKKAILFSNEIGSGLASLTKRRLDHFEVEMNIEEEVEILRFKTYWQNKKRIIDFVKIDVEGHELDVLKGFGDLIIKTKLVQFEFGGTNIDTRTFFQDFWYFFTKNNFRIYRISPKGKILINKYDEKHEYFLTTNYIAVNNRFN